MTPTNVIVPFVAFLEMIVLGHWKLDGSDEDIRLVKYYIFQRPVKPYIIFIFVRKRFRCD